MSLKANSEESQYNNQKADPAAPTSSQESLCEHFELLTESILSHIHSLIGQRDNSVRHSAAKWVRLAKGSLFPLDRQPARSVGRDCKVACASNSDCR